MNTNKDRAEKWVADDLEIGEEYVGEFVAILWDRIIAHGKDELEVMKAADRISENYVMAYCEPPEDMIL